jgi:hypothetical protein
VETSHFEAGEFVCARASGDEVFCGSCGDEIASTRRTDRHDALARHFTEQHPELAQIKRFRERTVQGARFFFYA